MSDYLDRIVRHSQEKKERRDREIVTRESLTATITQTCEMIQDLIRTMQAREGSK